MRKSTALFLLTLVSLALISRATLPARPALQSTPTPLDIPHAPSPLFDDPVWHGASDPFVIWNPVKNLWFMYYTQRRASLPNPNGVNWVHGSAIGIATSKDGTKWDYLGTCQGDHDLSEPLKATGKGPEPGVTWWAPCFLYENNTFHMWVVLVDGIYRSWTGNRNILHFTSEDGITWKYADTCKLTSDRVIDPTVYKVGDTWHMVYKDEAAGSRTFIAHSKDLKEWATDKPLTNDGGQEAPFVFHWKDSWWLIADNGRGFRVYKSPTGVDNFVFNGTLLTGTEGTRTRDNSHAIHDGIVLQGDQAFIFYFTETRTHDSVMQVAELELDPAGKLICNRNKYAPVATGPATQK